MTVIIPNFDVVVDGTEGDDYVLTHTGTTWTGQPLPATRYPLPSIPVRIVNSSNNYNFSKGDWGRFIRFTGNAGKLVLPNAGPGTPNPNWPIGVQALIQNACGTDLTISPAAGAHMRSRAGNDNPLVSIPGGQQIHIILIAAGIWAVSEHAVGAQGEPGAPGAEGAQGNQGEQGIQGLQGEQGIQGIQGPAGAPGLGITYKGTQANAAALPSSGNTLGDAWITLDNNHTNIWSGTDWDDVGTIQGPQGIQGIQGEQGIAGATGLQGVAGDTGPQGPAGEAGETGPEGPQGIQGIQGPAGEQGPQGEQGEQGVPSIVGVFKGAVSNSGSLPISGNTLGDTYLVTSNNHLWIWDGSSWLDAGATGQEGPQGPQGEPGEPGAAGAAGQGVPTGGTTGQALVKTSDSDYATAWQTVSGGGSQADWDATSGSSEILNKPDLAVAAITSGSISGADIFLKAVASSPAAGNVYTSANTLRYRDSTNTERILLNATDNLSNLASPNTALGNLLPAQGDHSGKALYTNGTSTYWDMAGAGGGESSVILDKTSTNPAVTTTTLTYSSGGDTNGVFYFAGKGYTSGGSWVNPVTGSFMTVTSSSLQNGSLQFLVDRTSTDSYTTNGSGQWILFDFGSGKTFRPNGFTWRTRNTLAYGAYALKNWKLQGSHDGTTFTTIQSWTNDNTQNTVTADAWSFWSVTQPATGYRYIRILQDGVNGNGDNYLVFNECEMYGAFSIASTTPAGYLTFNSDYVVPFYGAGTASLGGLGTIGLPPQAGYSGRFLSTNGTSAFWSAMAAVATSGSYDDLTEKPTIPAARAFTSSSDGTSHTVTLATGGGSFKLVEGTGITLTTTGTSSDGIITIASTSSGGALSSTSDATSHTLTSSGGGSIKLVEGTNVTLTTTGTGTDAIVTVAATGTGGTLSNTSDGTSHTVTSSGGGSVQFVEGSGITLTTTGTGSNAIVTLASSGGSGSGVEVNTVTVTTASLADQAIGTVTFDPGKVAAILNIATDYAAWISVFGNSSAAATDSRSQPFTGTPPSTASGYYAEFLTATGTLSLRAAPTPIVQCPTNAGVLRVQNRSGATRAIQVTMIVARLVA